MKNYYWSLKFNFEVLDDKFKLFEGSICAPSAFIFETKKDAIEIIKSKEFLIMLLHDGGLKLKEKIEDIAGVSNMDINEWKANFVNMKRIDLEFETVKIIIKTEPYKVEV